MTPTSPNPYSAPTASFDGVQTGRCRREGPILVASTTEHLPPRCVKCNAPAAMDKPRTFEWHHPGWYLLVPLVVYVIVGRFVRKKATLVLGLCDQHRRRRLYLSLASLAVFFSGLAGLYLSARSGNSLLWLLSCLVILASLLLRIAAMRVLRPVFIDRHDIRLTGCGPAFLDSLPGR
ncbi:hypothetical protein F2P45_25325 [Massilia sp. CCM 8733]|uniref:Uncharacterized protein n=1 Tax=Massilia mucilaginosa TaxID=2609282 RepID=A0ABX0NZ58_9BURK|nr:hypothetical protein [Massilia mucilaginosa]NHZ92301.1 hypothetical protein [Massilia mucilaginosa]